MLQKMRIYSLLLPAFQLRLTYLSYVGSIYIYMFSQLNRFIPSSLSLFIPSYLLARHISVASFCETQAALNPEKADLCTGVYTYKENNHTVQHTYPSTQMPLGINPE